MLREHILQLPLQQLKTNGETATCLCPFHDDTHPSLNINLTTGGFHCFSCGESGNFSKLKEKITGESSSSGLRHSTFFLSSDYTQAHHDSDTHAPFSILGQLLMITSKNKMLHQYISNRGITQNFIDYFDIKYLKHAKIISPTKGSMDVYNRLAIPIYVNSKLISMELRDFSGTSKAKKVLYPKGASVSNIFNLDRLDKNKPLYVTEGIMDLIPLFESGYRNISCIFGASLTHTQKEVLNQFKTVVLLPDNDAPGLKVIDELDEALDREFYIALCPKHRADPGDCTKEELDLMLKNKKFSLDYRLDKEWDDIPKYEDLAWYEGDI